MKLDDERGVGFDNFDPAVFQPTAQLVIPNRMSCACPVSLTARISAPFSTG